MSQPGLGVMIGMLGGNEDSAKAFSSSIGKQITSLSLAGDALNIGLNDNSKLILKDEGQSCCEHRYMVCDDGLDYFVGSTLLGGELRDGGGKEGEHGDTHEIQFLVITTSKGMFTVSNHNEHNGYYGGFCVRASLEVSNV